jgi:hypothetical protein
MKGKKKSISTAAVEVKKEEEPLYKRYREWASGLPEDRTSQEEQSVRKKLNLEPKKEEEQEQTVEKMMDTYLEDAVLFLLFVYVFTLPELDFSPPDPNSHTPVQLRDKRLLQKAKASYEIIGPHLKKIGPQIHTRVLEQLKGCNQDIRAVHEELLTLKMQWCGTSVQRYVPQTPPLHDCITGKQLAADSGYVMLHPCKRAVSKEDYVYLSSLHVAYHFWDYVMRAFQEQEMREGKEEEMREDSSIYIIWNRWWGSTEKYMGATPFRQRILQLRAMFLAAAAAQ